MSDITNFEKSTIYEWHFELPTKLDNGSPGPGAFVGAEKTKEQCPVKIEFSFRPHEMSTGESDGKLIAWACAASEANQHLVRMVLRSFNANGDEAGLAHGHGDDEPGDCLLETDVLCDDCVAFGRARNLMILK